MCNSASALMYSGLMPKSSNLFKTERIIAVVKVGETYAEAERLSNSITFAPRRKPQTYVV
jgi:hypothetical protein